MSENDYARSGFMEEIGKALAEILESPRESKTAESWQELAAGLFASLSSLTRLTTTTSEPDILPTTLWPPLWVVPNNGERAAMLAVLAQLQASIVFTKQDVPVGEPGDGDPPAVQQRNFKEAADRHANNIQSVLHVATTSLMLTAGAAVGAGNFDGALTEIEAAVDSFVEAQGLLDGYHEAVTEGENYDTIIKRVDLKIGLNNALFAIQRDLRHVKTALALVT